MIDKVALIILDGWGHSTETKHNAISQAKTPFFNYLIIVIFIILNNFFIFYIFIYFMINKIIFK
jgi:hypothetical protein